MSYDLTNLLVVAISSTALFENRAEHDLYLKKSLDDYIDHQISRENEPFAAGAALPLIRALLQLNDLIPGHRLVEVVILSNMEPEVGVRVMNSVEHHQLDITRAAFIGGEPVAKYLAAYNVKLFLSRSETDVQEALDCGVAAGLLYDPPTRMEEDDLKQLRIAFDGDAVIFSDDSERIFQEQGIDAFYRHEKSNAENPMAAGPFAAFLRAISAIQKECGRQGGEAPIRTALVTARSSPAHKRVILTLRAWGIRIDEMFFMGGVSKDQILKQFNPHIFFDDQHAHAGPASEFVPSARVLTPRIVKRENAAEGGVNG